MHLINTFNTFEKKEFSATLNEKTPENKISGFSGNYL